MDIGGINMTVVWIIGGTLDNIIVFRLNIDYILYEFHMSLYSRRSDSWEIYLRYSLLAAKSYGSFDPDKSKSSEDIVLLRLHEYKPWR